MNNNRFASGFVGTALATVISGCGVSCLISGFGLHDVFGIVVIFFCAFFAIFSAVCFSSHRGHIPFWIASAALLLLCAETLLLSLEKLIYTISVFYNSGYGWGTVRWSTQNLFFASLEPALILVGCLIVLAVNQAVIRRRWLGLAVFAGLLPLMLCCVVTDTVPDAVSLMGLLSSLLLLILTHRVRRIDPRDANRLTAMILVPVILVSGLLFRYSSKNTYRRQAQELQDLLLDWAGDLARAGILPDDLFGGSHSTPVKTQKVDLSDVGPQRLADYGIMEVLAPFSGTVYLRGQSYDTYTGTAWEANMDTQGEGGWPTGPTRGNYTLTVTTLQGYSYRHFPYYIGSEEWTNNLRDGVFDNPNRKTQYTFNLLTQTTSVTLLSNKEQQTYTDLPEDTMTAAQAILDRIFNGEELNTRELAAAIGNYVKNSASYDLKTSRMPTDQKDFAIWFLEESDSGYCVHFASAAAVLLRAAGIPARYVTGYRTEAAEGQASSVNNNESHAWVEYFDPEKGWTVLEATPGSGSTPAPTEPSTTTPTETTEPSETTEPTQPSTTPQTRPSNPVQTAPGTKPSQSTAPTAPTAPGGGSVDTPWNLEWLKWLLLAVALWAVVAGQYCLRKRQRQKRLNKGDRNQQALHRWKYIRHLTFLAGKRSSGRLRDLADKAAFSQHLLSIQELNEFDQQIDELHGHLLNKPWPVKWLLKLILSI